ncbi:pyridoxamine 5'-phosphate oxidase family protein [Planctomycetota bacterium]
MIPEAELKERLHELFAVQHLGVLATHNDGQPYASLMAFAATEDLRTLVFATPRATRKYTNLLADSRAALLIENRTNTVEDFSAAMAVTAVGAVQPLDLPDESPLVALYLSKHAYLRDFVQSPSCAVLSLVVERYHVVDHFQHVTEWHLTKKT